MSDEKVPCPRCGQLRSLYAYCLSDVCRERSLAYADATEHYYKTGEWIEPDLDAGLAQQQERSQDD